MCSWMLNRFRSHYILVMMIVTRFVGLLGGSLTIYYVNLTVPWLTRETHFEAMAAPVVVLAIVLTLLMALWETRRLRPLLKAFHRGQVVELSRAVKAGEEAVQFCGVHHLHEAILVPLCTTLPVCFGMWWFEGAGGEILLHIVIATFLGISTSLLCTYFAIEKWMQPVIRFLLDRGVPIAYDRMPTSSMRVRMNISFSVIIVSTALMIGALAHERAKDIIRHPERQAETVANLQQHIMYIFVVAVIIGFALSRVLANSVASRVATLVEAMKRVEEGCLSERLMPTGNDEVDGLARQFNAMVDNLAQSDYTIRDLNANLERKVDKRTRQLSKSRRTLKRSLEQMQQYDHLKTEFFANISHELRTPLTMILAPVERILQQQAASLPMQVSSMLETVRLNGRRLLELINRLLDFSKLEAGRMKLNKRPVDINKVVGNLVAAATPLAEQRGVRLEMQQDAALPRLSGDEEKIDIVVSNLLSNAIKFTPTGGSVHVETQLNSGHVRVAIRDTGIGLAPQDHERIFERFVQVDGSTSREFSGTGLGLALAKELVLLHDGEIRVESEVGKGSCFWFELPIGEPCSEAESPSEPAAVAARASVRFAELEVSKAEPLVEQMAATQHAPGTSTVLVVDDTADMRMLVGDILHDDYRVVFARDGAEGEQVALREHPDLIISDIMMPHVDGHELCRRIKANPATAHIPFVMLTAKADLDMKIAGLEQGADDYLSKPFEEKELKARARSLLKVRGLTLDLDKRNRDLESAYQELASIQTHLVQSEKMSSLGRLVAGLAHEINNSINAVYNGVKPLSLSAQSLEAIIAKFLSSPEAQAAPAERAEVERLFRKIFSLAKVIESGATRAMRIVTDLKSFSHPGNETLSEFDLHDALNICLNLMSKQIGERIAIKKEYGEVGTVFGPYGQLNQVFMNILSNAEQAIDGRGQITISTQSDGENVSVSMRDNGCGIPEEILDKIFDPFFTTKEVGIGTGLGLSLSYGIISKLGGSIRCHSTPGEGTEFVVTFPRVMKSSEQSVQPATRPVPPLILGGPSHETRSPVC